MLPPLLDQYFGLLQRVKDFPVQQLVSQLAVERLDVAVFPRTPRLDVQGPHSQPVVYLNEIWLAPFGKHISLDLLRGLSVLAIPVAIAGGLALSARPRLAPWLLGLCAAWAVASALWVVPQSCMVRPVALEELRDLRVERCRFVWRGPALRRPGGPQRFRGAGADTM